MRKRVLFPLIGIGAITLLFIILGYSLHFADGFKPSNAPKSNNGKTGVENIDPSEVAFLLNKGGIGSEEPKSNMNYGIWLTSNAHVQGGFETLNGADNFVMSQLTYNDGQWHNAILTFDENSHILKLFMDGVEVDSTDSNGFEPDSTGNQPIRLGANSLDEEEKVNGNYTGQLDDIQVWNFAFTNDEVLDLFKEESKNGSGVIADIDLPAVVRTVFAQDDKLPVVKNSKILQFSGQNYADVVNSKTINLNSFTISIWFNT